MRSIDFLTFLELGTPQEAAEYRPLKTYEEDAWFEDELETIRQEMANSMSYLTWVRRHTDNRVHFLNLLNDLVYSELFMRLDQDLLNQY